MQAKNNGYTAGIIDGEGCISIYIAKRMVKGKYVYRPILEISAYQADKRLIDYLFFHYGGHFYEHIMKNSSRPGYQWTAPRGKARELFLLELLPYLILKKEQALLALEYCKTSHSWDNQLKRFVLAKRCTVLNRKREKQSLVLEKFNEFIHSTENSPTTNTQEMIDNIEKEINIKIESDLHSDMQSATAVTQIA
jgi:hypothetical protein